MLISVAVLETERMHVYFDHSTQLASASVHCIITFGNTLSVESRGHRIRLHTFRNNVATHAMTHIGEEITSI